MKWRYHFKNLRNANKHKIYRRTTVELVVNSLNITLSVFQQLGDLRSGCMPRRRGRGWSREIEWKHWIFILRRWQCSAAGLRQTLDERTDVQIGADFFWPNGAIILFKTQNCFCFVKSPFKNSFYKNDAKKLYSGLSFKDSILFSVNLLFLQANYYTV